jgi:hypothetical protein
MADNAQNNHPESSPAAPEVVSLSGKFFEDRKRVRVEFELSDVSQKPNVELSLVDQDTIELAHAVILGVCIRQMNFTLHLNKPSIDESIWVKALLRTDDNPFLDQRIEQVQ